MKRATLIFILLVLLFGIQIETVQSGPIPSGIRPDEPVPAQSTSGPLPPSYVAAPSLAPGMTTAAVVIDAVPTYYWRHGCGPTAAGMVIGYYDMHGYPWLIPGDSTSQTEAVDEAIASQENPSAISNHYEDYSKPSGRLPCFVCRPFGSPCGR